MKKLHFGSSVYERNKVKKGVFIVIFCLLPLAAFGRARRDGWCQDGNSPVALGGLTTTAKYQRSYPSCTVTIYLAGTTTIASIYSDNSGTSKANPFTASSQGQWFAYANNGRYDVNFSGGGLASSFTLGDLLFTDIVLNVEGLATGGVGTSASPWTGWESAISTIAAAGINVSFGCGYFSSTSVVNVNTPSNVYGCGRGSTTLKFSGGGGLSFNPAAQVLGAGLHDMTILSTSTTQNTLTINNEGNFYMENLQIQGAGSGAAGTTQGINIANFSRSAIRSVEVRKYPGDCVAFNGESSGGIYITSLIMDECTGYDWNFTRTSTADSGDYFIVSLIGLNSTTLTKPGGIRWFSSAAGQSAIPTYCLGCAGDSTVGGDSIIMNNVTELYFVDGWGFNTDVVGSNKCGIALTSTGNITINGGKFRSASRAVCFYSSVTNASFTNNVVQDATNGFFYDAVGTKTRVDINFPINNGVTNLTNDATQIQTSRSTLQQILNGNVILGTDGSGNSQLRMQRSVGNGLYLFDQPSNMGLSMTTGAVDQAVFTVGEAAGAAFIFGNRQVNLEAPTTARASLLFPSGTAPTTPAGGQLWAITTGPGTPTRGRLFFYDGTTTMDVSLPTYNAAGTPTTIAHAVSGTVALVAGAATITLTNSAVYTAVGTFSCTATDQTAANAVRIVPASSTTITVAGTGADVIAYSCFGN